MKTSEEINEVVKAIASFQSEVESPKKNNANPAFKREGKAMKYADLDAIIKVITPALSKNGLSQMQFTSSDLEAKAVSVITMISHESGQYIMSDPLVLPAENFGKFNAQTIGSSITYGRRYSLSAILGIASEDDDDANTQSLNEKNNGGNHNSKKEKPPVDKQSQQVEKKQDLNNLIIAHVNKLRSLGMDDTDIENAYADIAKAEGVGTIRDVDKQRAVGHLKAYVMKLERENKQANQNTQQGSMLEGRTTKPNVGWGDK